MMMMMMMMIMMMMMMMMMMTMTMMIFFSRRRGGSALRLLGSTYGTGGPWRPQPDLRGPTSRLERPASGGTNAQ